MVQPGYRLRGEGWGKNGMGEALVGGQPEEGAPCGLHPVRAPWVVIISAMRFTGTEF